ncbi:ABC transporter ATP-binding protein [Cohnella lubricantis]
MELRCITKRYGRTEVLQDLSLDIREGQMIAIVGANGSGKSTLLRILAGLTAFTGGTVRRLPIDNRQFRVGYAPDRLPALRFTVREYLNHMAAIAGLDRSASGESIDSWLERLHLNAENTQMRHFSKGMLQKVNLIQAVLRQPDLLLLDEPHGGLDPDSRDDLAALIREERDRGATVVVATHDREWMRQSAPVKA